MPYSRVTYTAVGGPQVFAVNFTLGYLSQSHVTARVNNEVDGGGSPVYRALTWLTEGTVTVGGATLVANDQVVLQRTTPKDILYHNYTDGEILTEANLDESFLQAIMIAHEALDGRLGTFEADLNMGMHKITNMAPGVDASDAVTYQQLSDMTGNAPAFAAAAAASAATATAQAAISTTNKNLTAADVVTTNQAKLDAQAAFAATQALAGNINWTRVRVASTANLALTGTPTVDGVVLVAGNRVLAKNQSTGAQNGIYVVAAGAWSRATDADTWAELVSKVVQVDEGTVNKDLTFVITNDDGGTLGTTPVVVAAYSAAIANGAITTLKIADDNVTFAKLKSTDLATADNMLNGVANKIVTAAAVADSQKSTKCIMSATQSIPTGVWTPVVWDAESWDDDNWHSLGTTPERIITTFAGGRVQIMCSYASGSQAGAHYGVRVKKNGTVVGRNFQVINVGSVGELFQIGLVFETTASASDYFEMEVYQTSGAGLNLVTGSAGTSFTIRRLK